MRDRYTGPASTSAYATATAAASVGVKSPKRMPPRMTTTMKRGSRASIAARLISARDARSPAGHPCLRACHPICVIRPTAIRSAGTIEATNRAPMETLPMTP